MTEKVSLDALALNIVPITLSKDKIEVGTMPYIDESSYKKLREDNWQTHAFRFDNRFGMIFNVAIKSTVAPLGKREEVETSEHLLLIARAIQQAILIKIAPRNLLLKSGKQLLFLGQTDQSLLLKQAVAQAGASPVLGLDVAVRYEIDCRVFWDRNDNPYLGLVIDIATSNIIDIPVSALLKRGFQIVGRCVCKRSDLPHPFLHPKLEALGVVSSVAGNTLLLTDTTGQDRIDARNALIEPRHENLDEVVRLYYGSRAASIIKSLQKVRAPLVNALGKFDKIRETLNRLRERRIEIGNQLEVKLGDLLQETHTQFPLKISTERPVFLVGPQGRNTPLTPDAGISEYGPYKFMQHARSQPTIAVICESQFRGRLDQFLESLKFGYPQEQWDKANNRKDNPFKGGLIGKFRLVRVRIETEECENSSPAAYRNAIERLLQNLPEAPDLAIVQTREGFTKLRGASNPYFISKAAFMRAGIPIQAIQIEKVDSNPSGLAILLNTFALACYAKLDGTPWVISVRGPITHELIIGLGSSEISQGRFSPKVRYVGVTTVFQGDGRYLLWGITREAEYENYTQALLESLRTTIRHVQGENDWQPGDEVRLIFHVYKRLKDTEVEAIKMLVSELIKDKFAVKFAFLDISWSHPYQIVDPKQKGRSYSSYGYTRTRGKGVPARGLCLQISKLRGLLQLTGPNDVKTDEQGLPNPLLVELHYDSDFDDLPYLLRQVYHFTYMSWQSFFPASEPVTIKYSRMIARILGNLNTVPGWDSTVLTVGSLRGRRWFL